MEFLAIIAIATVILLWMFSGSKSGRPRRQSREHNHSLLAVSPPDGGKTSEIWQSLPMDEVEYFEALERHDKDPAHNPFPSPPSHRSSSAFADEERD